MLETKDVPATSLVDLIACLESSLSSLQLSRLHYYFGSVVLFAGILALPMYHHYNHCYHMFEYELSGLLD